MKKILPFAMMIFFSPILYSCNDFFTANGLKRDIQERIDYVNSPYMNIRIISDDGITSPSGDCIKKITDTVQISFSAYKGRQFIKWQAVDRETGKVYSDEEATNYIEFEDASTSDTSFKIKGYVKNLMIQPMAVEKPVVLSNAPFYKPRGDFINTTIKLIFDNNMDEGSIYYTGEELLDLGITDTGSILHDALSAPVSIESITVKNKVYGYIGKDGKKHYKNIYITDNADNNILENFLAPLFISQDTLIIPANASNPPEAYSRVSVKIKNFYYSIDGKKVLLDNELKWVYQVNSELEDKSPETESIRRSKDGITGDTYTFSSEYEYIENGIPLVLPEKILYIKGGVKDPPHKNHQVAQTGGGVYKKLYINDVDGSGIEAYYTVDLFEPETQEIKAHFMHYYTETRNCEETFRYRDTDGVTKSHTNYWTEYMFGKMKSGSGSDIYGWYGIDFSDCEPGVYGVKINLYDCANNITSLYTKIQF